MILPRYPVYVPSKGRHETCLTGKFLVKDGVPFYLVVEPAERDLYAREFGTERLLVLPWDNPPGTPDGLIKARNWIRDHSAALGAARHWQIDDNINRIARLYKGRRITCPAGAALRAVEDLSDRYENVAISGLNYWMFGGMPNQPPMFVNVHVYSCTLVLNALPYRWRLRYNDDTDLCLQALSNGWCTILVNAFLAYKRPTMTVKGGNTDALYRGDGRLRMARMLERQWPGVVKTVRKFKRPQHAIVDQWARFDTPLKRRADVDWDALAAAHDEYGMVLDAAAEVKHPDNQKLLDEYRERNKGR